MILKAASFLRERAEIVAESSKESLKPTNCPETSPLANPAPLPGGNADDFW